MSNNRLRHKVSIVIPCYNQGRFLAESVESALVQTYSNIEVIVVNDGSTDETAEVVRNYGQQLVYVEQNNGGLSAARNAGLKIATGQYVVFLDSDDLLAPSVVSSCMDAMENTGAALAISAWSRFSDDKRISDDNVRIFEPAETYRSGESLLESLCHGTFPVHAALVMRSWLPEPEPFDVTLRSHEDLDLWSRLALRGARYVLVPDIGAYYRQHGDSMSRNKLRMLETRAEVQLRYLCEVTSNTVYLQKYGVLILDNLVRGRFQLLVWRGSPELISRLWQGIRVLEKVGVRPHTGLRKNIAHWLLGRLASSWSVGIARCCIPSGIRSWLWDDPVS